MFIVLLAAAVISLTPAHKKIPLKYVEWSHVAKCEEGGWNAPGGNYPDALGIDRVNYLRFGGTPDQGHISMKHRLMEIRVAERLRAFYHINIPDQNGCSAW